MDCHGVCGGPGRLDTCDKCDGPGLPWIVKDKERACDCAGNKLDCADICGGENKKDECHVC